MTTRSRYFDRQGQPITLEEWCRTFEDVAIKRVALTNLPNGIDVSTVWLGLDHGSGSGPPIIFETMTFGSSPQDQERYATEEEALAGHERMVAKWAPKTKQEIGPQSKAYLGDSVYVALDPRGGVILTTENGMGPSNTIVLEPEVIASLELYLKRLADEKAEGTK